jgi:wobble nucleotide-excising tRNase
MFEAIKKGADLIILDDPISSFDKNKKFAILSMLFGKSSHIKTNLRDRTVLMLTHDFEPIIDIIYNNLPKLENKNSYFLENN